MKERLFKDYEYTMFMRIYGVSPLQDSLLLTGFLKILVRGRLLSNMELWWDYVPAITILQQLELHDKIFNAFKNQL